MRLRFTMTKTMYVDVPADEAAVLVDPQGDHLNIIEAADRYRRIAAYNNAHFDADLSVEKWGKADSFGFEAEPIDGTERERYLWSARHFVEQARRELNQGRYREGRCPELDRVNRDLGRLEDWLRLMALEVDHPDLPEVVAWRSRAALRAAADAVEAEEARA